MTAPLNLAPLDQQHRKLVGRLSRIGPILKGSVVESYTRCGTPNCRCRKEPPQLHGPYWQWSTSVDGKTVTRRLRDEELPLYQEWVNNRKQLETILEDMHRISLQAAEQHRRQVRESTADN